MDEIVLVKDIITANDLKKIAACGFGDLVKAVIDIRLGIMALGGDMHADEEAVLIEQGSSQSDLWGINIYTNLPRSNWIEFDSMINIRPRQNNLSRNVEDHDLQKKIIEMVNSLVKE